MLINFCDSSLAIGESTIDESLRYVKQIKARNTEIKFDEKNVAVYRIVKPSNFLHFEDVEQSSEFIHLRQILKEDDESLTQRILELKVEGKSLREIGRGLKLVI